MKTLWGMICAAVVLSLPALAAEYPLAEEPLDGAANYQSLLSAEEAMLQEVETLRGLDDTNAVLSESHEPADGSVPFDQAVSVYVFPLEDWLDFLESNGPYSGIETAGELQWRIPTYEGPDGFGVTIAAPDTGGLFSTEFCPPEAVGYDDWIFHPDHLQQQLAAAGVPTGTSCKLVYAPFLSAIFAAVDLDGESRFLSCASEPDFLGIDNGALYSAGELLQVSEAYYAQGLGGENTGGGTGAAGPEEDRMTENRLLLPLLLLGLCCAAAALFIWRKCRRA